MNNPRQNEVLKCGDIYVIWCRTSSFNGIGVLSVGYKVDEPILAGRLKWLNLKWI
jgi:hypothetical protein